MAVMRIVPVGAAALLVGGLASAALMPAQSALERDCMLSETEQWRIDNFIGRIDDRISPLSRAIVCNDIDRVREALGAGADPNRREVGNKTPVIFAAALGRTAILAALLDAGGNPDSYDADTKTLALQWAMSVGIHEKDWSSYELLLARGADIHFTANPPLTIALSASNLGQWARVSELIDRGYRRNLPRLLRSVENSGTSEEAKRDAVAAKIRALIAAGEGRP